MRVFHHHIYEYKKGLRFLILHTMEAKYREHAERKLKKYGIAHIIKTVSEKKINVFFGAEECIEVLKVFGDKRMSQYSDEEDFILGIMLGYCRKQQCRRFLKRKGDRDEQTG